MKPYRRPLRLACDIDGVLAEYNSAFAAVLRAHGALLTLVEGHEPSRWLWYRHYGATPEQIEQSLAYTASHPKWWYQLACHADFTFKAKRQLNQLCDACEVTFVTARPCGREATADWLGFHNFGEFCHVILTPNKPLALIGLAPDVVIEDNHLTLEACVRALPDTRLLLVDRPYNRVHVSERVERCASTLEALEKVREMCCTPKACGLEMIQC